MAHPEQHSYVAAVKSLHPGHFIKARVLEIGSLNVNGTVRTHFTDCEYTGCDVGPGPCVDVVGAAHTLNLPRGSFDTIISCECLEHDKFWPDTLKTSVESLRDGGLLVLTWASPAREPHGVTAHDPWASPHTTDHYAAPSMYDVLGKIAHHCPLVSPGVEVAYYSATTFRNGLDCGVWCKKQSGE